MLLERFAKPAPASRAVPDGAVLLGVNAGGVVRSVSRGAHCERWLARMHEGGQLEAELLSIDLGLAQGLAAAARERLACSGRRVVRPLRGPHLLSYGVFVDEDDDQLEIVLTALPSSSSDVLSHLHREQERWAAAMEALRTLDSGASRDGGVGSALSSIVRATGMESGAVFAGGDKGRARLLAAYGPTHKRGYPYLDLLLDWRPLEPLLRGAHLLVLPRGKLQDSEAIRAVVPSRARWALVAPVRVGDLITGVVALGTIAALPPSLSAGQSLEAVADALSLALSTIALSRESDQSAAVLETAAAVAGAISGSLDLDDTFRQIALSAARIMGGCRCLLLQAQGASHEFTAVASSDAGDASLIGLRIRFEDEADPGAALAQRRSIVVENLVFGAGTDPALRSRLQVRSALFVPITSEGQSIGSLLFCSRGGTDDYSAQDIARAETVAEQAASAICNARLFGDLERSQEQAESLLRRITGLRERQRMEFANVVHDDIVQSVVAALYELESLRHRVGGDAVAPLERASGLLRCAIGDARRVIHDLRPPVLDGLGLSAAVRVLAEQSEGAQTRVCVDIDDVGGLPPAATTALYMVAREALQNARRHSGATGIDVRLRIEEQSGHGRDRDIQTSVVLTVVDDGCGFDAGGDEREDHFGLTMMDEQMALAGGSLVVASAQGSGTRVEARVPMAAAAPSMEG